MKEIILITGMAGVGKTTILKELKKIANEKKKNMSILNFGTVMDSILKDKGMVLKRDAIRKQKIKEQKNIQIKAAETILRKLTKEILIIDTHVFIPTEAGFLVGLPYEVLKKLEPSMLVLIEASARDILKRRNFSSNRIRDKQTIEEIELGLEWSRYIASACSTLAGIPVKIIVNKEGKQKQVAKSLFNILNEQFGE
ncbi:MAG: adenylate kinase [Candidatus Bathyarchaeota archaeon]|nr:adenylate kinase [Candidatus Bathyarchaeota archaeon]